MSWYWGEMLASRPKFSLLVPLGTMAAACSNIGDQSGLDGLPPILDATAPDALVVPEAATDLTRDIIATDLELDLRTQGGVARVTIAPSQGAGMSFEVGDLVIERVRVEDIELRTAIDGARLDVGVPPSETPTVLTIDYHFAAHADFDGYMPPHVTFLWPYFCGNLFPCHSAPSDGARFSLAVTGIPEGKTAIYPSVIPADAPSYMPAIAIGDYVHEELGMTTAGTRVHVWYLAGGEAAARTGTADLVGVFDWYEQTLGAYVYGDSVGSVSADWGPGDYGGMEHHPYWHVGSGSMDDAEIHAHEAAHGWFGDGVRIRCWEDFVLSEGTVSYLAARALEQVAGAAAGTAIWAEYQEELDYLVGNADTIAWPATCNAIDILNDPLWSGVPYMKGAFFLRAVEEQVGRDAMDAALAAFYGRYAGNVAGMQDLLDVFSEETGFDPAALAQGWLQSLGTP